LHKIVGDQEQRRNGPPRQRLLAKLNVEWEDDVLTLAVRNRRAGPMDERRKYAYRHMLYYAMLHIRQLAWLPWGNPLRWRNAARQTRLAGVLADWLHNLALFAALDFAGFDEEWFWRDGQSMKSLNPEFNLEWYRRFFEEQLSEATDA